MPADTNYGDYFPSGMAMAADPAPMFGIDASPSMPFPSSIAHR